MKKRILLILLIAVFIIAMSYGQSITITSPHGGESWALNSTHTVSWSSSGVSGNIIVQLYQGGHSQGAIYNGGNSGSFPWTINNYLNGNPIATGTYNLRVKSLSDPSVYDEVSITITNASSSTSTITVTNPHSGDSWYKGNICPYTIKWTTTGSMDSSVEIVLYKSGESRRFRDIAEFKENDGEYQWHIPADLPEGIYRIRITTSDLAVSGFSEEFSIIGSSRYHFSPKKVKLRDLGILNISLGGPLGGDSQLVVRIKNEFVSFNGDLKFRLQIYDESTHRITVRVITRHLTMAVGERKNVCFLGGRLFIVIRG